MAQQGCLREGLTGQLLSTILTPAGPDLQGEEWSGREGSIIRGFCSPSWLHLCVFERDFGLFPGEGPKTPKLANLASPQLRK